MAAGRLVRSSDDRMLGGVCGGLAEYSSMDPTLVRLLWVLFTLLGGAGLPLYLVAWYLIPDRAGRRNALPLILVLFFLVVPGSCCWLSWLAGMAGSLFGAGL